MSFRSRNGGYTIVEVMIFLVITGLLLISAMAVFQGRQERTRFTQGVREFDAQIRTIVNETGSGFYPNKNFTCTSTGGGVDITDDSSTEQGKNTNCIFLGRVIAFSKGSSYKVYTMIGQREGSNNKIVTQYGNQDTTRAMQTLVTPIPTLPNQDDAPDAFAEFDIPWGITIKRIVRSPSNNEIGAFGFVYSLGSFDTNGTDLTSAATSLNLVPLAGTGLNGSTLELVNKTKDIRNNDLNPGKITLCLQAGNGGRQAAITIGGNNNNVGTEVVLDNVPAECN